MQGFVIGLDLGTSGVRAVAVDASGKILGLGAAKLPPTKATGTRREQSPEDWWNGCRTALDELGKKIDLAGARAIAVDATSGTILPVDNLNRPLAQARMYDDADTGDLAAKIKSLAPRESAAHGATSPAARALEWTKLPRLHCILHQADWINVCLGATDWQTDENNALKTGYDPVSRTWPDWLRAFGLSPGILPEVVPAGTPIGRVSGQAANALGIPEGITIAAGTTDGCATFLASGATEPGEASTALGSTIVLKLLCDRPIFAPELGIYSHRIGDTWLAGGASNCGGKTLLQFFTPQQLTTLEPSLDPSRPTGTDFYPLPSVGERFPVSDPKLAPRLTPRPADDAHFLQGIYEAFARVEQRGFAKLAELGGPAVRSVRHAGGGSKSAAWMSLRAKSLGVPLAPAWSEEAAAGAARLAWRSLGHEITFA
ncbi:MAG: carbohydrate kinase [Verrucomicrobia bacterium]|nr:carbohydrate kinase [Verrucomicrobiota bacterium]